MNGEIHNVYAIRDGFVEILHKRFGFNDVYVVTLAEAQKLKDEQAANKNPVPLVPDPFIKAAFAADPIQIGDKLMDLEGNQFEVIDASGSPTPVIGFPTHVFVLHPSGRCYSVTLEKALEMKDRYAAKVEPDAPHFAESR